MKELFTIVYLLPCHSSWIGYTKTRTSLCDGAHKGRNGGHDGFLIPHHAHYDNVILMPFLSPLHLDCARCSNCLHLVRQLSTSAQLRSAPGNPSGRQSLERGPRLIHLVLHIIASTVVHPIAMAPRTGHRTGAERDAIATTCASSCNLADDNA